MWKWCLAAILLLFFIHSILSPVSHHGGAKRIVQKWQVESFHAALALYWQDTGRYPTEAEGLQALRQSFGVKGWNGPYLAADVPTDPWNRPYEYRLSAQSVPLINGTGPP